MQRRDYIRALGSLPIIATGMSGCLSNSTSEAAKQALTTQEIGEQWMYTDTGSPTVADSGTIVAKYHSNDPYSRTVTLRLWPCEGETLEDLGSCSLGNLPDQKRANESVETESRSFSKNAFLWWSSTATDIEVVTPNHVFRFTHTPAADSSQETPPRDDRIEELTKIARLQMKKLTK